MYVVMSAPPHLVSQGPIDKIGRAARLPKGSSNLHEAQLLQSNNFCTQCPNCFIEALNCSPVLGLHMDLKISKNRWWRIELFDDVQSGCGEGGEHSPSSIEFGVGKTSTYNIFCITSWN